MNSSLPKSSRKRRRSSSESSKSFVENIASRMSALLPSTITKWFRSTNACNRNGSPQVADATDSSTEDEATENPITQEPPVKKIRHNSQGDFNQHVPIETRCSSTNTESIDDTCNVVLPVGRSNNQRENIFESTVVCAVNDSTETAAQTSFKRRPSFSSNEHLVPTRKNSLFGASQHVSKKKHSHSTCRNVRDPYFKPSLLSSPFYVGRTMRGGGGCFSNPSFNKNTVCLKNETSKNVNATMSQSARCIKDLLEHYSSPLRDAKRIAQITSFKNSSQQTVNPYGAKNYSHKTQELNVPSVASILTIKRNSSQLNTTNTACQIIASHSSSSDFLPYSETNFGSDGPDKMSSDKLVTNINSRLTKRNREKNMEMESSDTVNLPNVVSHSDQNNLSKFAFGSVQTSQPTLGFSIQTPVIITPEALKKTSESENLDGKHNNESNKSYKLSTLVKNLESNIEKIQDIKTKDEQLPFNTNNKIILDNNKLNGGKKPTEIGDDSKKCSSCNISIKLFQRNKCADCEKKTNNINEPFVVTEKTTTKWKCNDCGVDNSETVNECVCCDGKNNKKIITAAAIESKKVVESEWKCNTCWIKNKNSLLKCAACGDLKPGSEAISCNNLGNNAVLKDTQGDNKVKETLDPFKIIAKTQSEKWECSLCLVRNESNRDTCICCEGSKPGTKKESHTKFNFHQPSEITFTFGIPPVNQEKCTDIESEECNMGEESETNNNILPKTSTFNFGSPVKELDLDVQPEYLDKSAEGPKISATAVVPKERQMSHVRNIIFGIPSKSIKTNKNIEEKPQEVPQITISVPGSDDSVTSQVAPENSALAPLHVINQTYTGSDTPSKTQQNKFTFPSMMPGTNLFATTSTTTTTMSNESSGSLNPTSSTTFQKPSITTTTASSFLQKSDSSVPSLGVPLFSGTEATTTTTTTTTTTSTSVPMGTVQPVFGFRGQGSVPQAEKPTFNFTFTSNNTDAPTNFKPAFGATTDSNISTDNFNMPSNSIISANALSGSPLNTTYRTNTATPGSGLTAPSGLNMFDSAVSKDNVWPSNTSSIFGTKTTTKSQQNVANLPFATSGPFSTNNASFGSTTQPAQPNNSPFGSTTQPAQPNNSPFCSTTQPAQPNNGPFGSTAQQVQPSNPAFGSIAQQSQPNNTPFGSTTQQALPNNAPFGSTPQHVQRNNPAFGSIAQQTQSNNSPFGSTTQQAQPNNGPFGTTVQQGQTNNAAFGSTTQPAQPNNSTFSGTTQQTQPNNTAFGSTPQQTQPSSATFGSTVLPTQSGQQPQNVFGIQTTTNPSLFRNHLQNQTTQNMFTGVQVANNPLPMGMFGAPNQGVTPSFGALNSSIPTFETPSLAPPQPAPASFNFSGHQPTGIFGFGQQQQQPSQAAPQPENQPGMYGFGGPTGPAPQMQFTIGCAPNTSVRRVRKALRRTQR